jgi:CIC family chloride channel protein
MTEAYIIDDQQNLIGKLSIHNLLGDANYLDSLARDPLNLTITQPLTEALEVASEFVGESIPILEGTKLRGAINEGDLFKKILDIEDSLRSDQSSNSKH